MMYICTYFALEMYLLLSKRKCCEEMNIASNIFFSFAVQDFKLIYFVITFESLIKKHRRNDAYQKSLFICKWTDLD